MKVVILAAGKGGRLGDVPLPKPLTKLANGQSILGAQLENIRFHCSLNNVILVVGYRKEKIMEQFPDLLYVYNPLYAQENTAKSLLRALNKVEDDLLWMNGDVVFHPSVLEALLALKKTSMVVNYFKVGEEEVKYFADPQGRIQEVSKEVKNAQGEALGINFFKAKDLPLLKEKLTQCATRDYFEKAIELCIEEKMEVQAVRVDADKCAEIDFPEDLTHANKLLLKWQNLSQ
jgi:choline kinase